ncbi:unnamed protein product [Paramecium octaurelia]|uniref:Uncharacterized protein n=1 Tax=Paramecium octaurelia TaxID=43137 RepID=A0A8S1W600_PAROT|nr:unnamed protein product [Paramecium octaurelia]
MNFLDHFKGRTQRIPREGYLNLFGLESNRVVQNPQISKSKLNQSLQKIQQEEAQLQYEIMEIDEYQLKRYSKISTEITTPRSFSSKKNFSAIRSAKLILKY